MVGKDDIGISLISEHSKNILRRIGKDSDNPIITIADVARTPQDQATQMYNKIEQNGVISVGTYKSQVHSVIDIHENLIEQNKKE